MGEKETVAKSKRFLLKRQIAHSARNVSLAINHLAEVEQAFAGTHDDFAEYLQTMIVTLDAVRDGIKNFCLKAWGNYPDDWESWRNVGKPDRSGYDKSERQS